MCKEKREHTRASKLYENNLLLRAGSFAACGDAGRGEAANYLYNVTKKNVGACSIK